MDNFRKYADSYIVKHLYFLYTRKKISFICILCVMNIFFSLPLFSYFVSFKEQYYSLFHQHYQQYPDDVMENIYWLEQAVMADFANPRYAEAKIENEIQWEKYRYLFMMHINLKLAEQHMRLALNWDRFVAYFYDAPWKEQYIRDLETAESCYKAGLYYWSEAQLWAEKASQKQFRFVFLTDIQFWEDELYRINDGSLNYERTINRELARLTKMKETYTAMDSEF